MLYSLYYRAKRQIIDSYAVKTDKPYSTVTYFYNGGEKYGDDL